MNRKEYENKKNLLDPKYNTDTNIFKTNPQNTYLHETAKFLVFLELRKNKSELITEAIFKNQKRADILDLTNNVAYEITATETKKRSQQKEKDYPVTIRFLEAKKVIEIAKKKEWI